MKFFRLLIGAVFFILNIASISAARADGKTACLNNLSDGVNYSVCGMHEFMFPSHNKLQIKGFNEGQRPQILTQFIPGVGQTEAATSWVANGIWENGEYKLDLKTPGVYSIHLRIYNADGTESKNLFMGQIRIIDPFLISQLFYDVYFKQFSVTRYSAAPVEWVSFSKERSKIKSLDDLESKIKANFPKVEKYYSENFPNVPSKDYIALYSLNVIANYWRLETCILAQENPPKTQIDYFKSNGACCSDFTLVLLGILKKLGYNPEIATLPGHNLIQIVLSDGKTYLFDGTGNYFIEGSLEEIRRKESKLELHLINFNGLKEGERTKISDERRQFMNTIFLQFVSFGYDDFEIIKNVHESWLAEHAKLLGIE